MIIARFGSIEILNSSVQIKAPGYEGKYWFPIESFTFGIKERQKMGGHDAASKGAASGKSVSSKSAGSASSDKSTETEDRHEVTISRLVDVATCNLMSLTMLHRTKDAAKGDEEKIQADIHVLSSVRVLKDNTEVSHVFPNLMIHLEGVLLLHWEISGSGDARPTENLAFKYDRSAMAYMKTPDGKMRDPLQKAGFDQKENKSWSWEGKGFGQFIP